MTAPEVWRRAVWAVIVVALSWTVAGCPGAPDTPAAPPPIQAPTATRPLAQPSVTLPDGHRIQLELAVTPEEISQGLMFRPSLAEDRGMLFLFDQERRPSFWMKNTLVPLDLVFLDGVGVVADVIADAQPCAADPCPQYVPSSPARAVLEITAGNARRHGAIPGAQLVFERVPGFPVTD